MFHVKLEAVCSQLNCVCACVQVLWSREQRKEEDGNAPGPGFYRAESADRALVKHTAAFSFSSANTGREVCSYAAAAHDLTCPLTYLLGTALLFCLVLITRPCNHVCLCPLPMLVNVVCTKQGATERAIPLAAVEKSQMRHVTICWAPELVVRSS